MSGAYLFASLRSIANGLEAKGSSEVLSLAMFLVLMGASKGKSEVKVAWTIKVDRFFLR